MKPTQTLKADIEAEIVKILGLQYDLVNGWYDPECRVDCTHQVEQLLALIEERVVEGRIAEASLFKQYFRGRTQAYANTRIEQLRASPTLTQKDK